MREIFRLAAEGASAYRREGTRGLSRTVVIATCNVAAKQFTYGHSFYSKCSNEVCTHFNKGSMA